METHRSRIDYKKIELAIKVMELKIGYLERTLLEVLVKQDDLDDSHSDLKILKRELSSKSLDKEK